MAVTLCSTSQVYFGSMVFTLFYLSRSTLCLPQEAAQVDAIVDVSRRFNAKAGISGALMFTEQNFAQFLEGPEAEVRTLLTRLVRDTRHRDVDVVLSENSPERRFFGWSMAYSGPHLFVEQEFERLIGSVGETDRSAAARVIIDLMSAFCGIRPLAH